MDGEQASVTLVVATRGRTVQLEELFENLTAQDFKDFDVILVDQNDDDRLEAICERWRSTLRLRRIWTPTDRGLSRGRNVGWAQAQGSFVLFPDDDCWYPPWLLSRALQQLRLTGADILTGRAADEAGRDINGRFEKVAQWVNTNTVWTTQIEWVVFFKRSALQAVGGYDVDIGVGASTPWQSCEGQDIVLRALAKGLSCYYDPSIYGHHGLMDIETFNKEMCRKGRMYGRGLGHVLRIHKFGAWSAMNWLLRPTIKACFFLVQAKLNWFRYFRDVAIGRWEGWSGKLIS